MSESAGVGWGSRGGPRALTQPLPAGIIEIRSIRVGVVALKAVHTGFFVAMSRQGRLYGSVSASQGWPAVAGAGLRWVQWLPHTPDPAAGLHCPLQVPGAH